MFVLFSACSKCYATTESIVDISQEYLSYEKSQQDQFILLCLYPFLENSTAWQNQLKPIFDYMHEQNLYPQVIIPTNINNRYQLVCYNTIASGTTTINFSSRVDSSITESLSAHTYENIRRYTIDFNSSNNTFTVSTATLGSHSIPDVMRFYVSDLWYDFINLVYGSNGGTDYTSLLNSILNYLNDIEDHISHIDTTVSVDRYGYILSQIYAVCSTISQNIGNYSQDLQDIQDKLDDINDELTDIYNYLNDPTLNTNTITNNFPNNSGITSPTDSALANIFTAYQNAFTSTNYTDIVIPLGYVNKSITIPSNYTETFFPTALVTIIQLCYWYVISRWILLYLIKLVNSLRNADFLETRSSSDPKTELL